MELNKAKELANKLIEKHGLTNQHYSWRFEFDNARRRFGRCNYRSHVISLSKHLVQLNNEDEVKNTILHEIAHALVGRGHGHDSVWKRKALEIGCDGNRCYNIKDVKQPKAKYEAVCNGCKQVIKRHRVSKKQMSCGKCSGGKFNPEFILEFKLVA